ncbi:MAG: peroxidase-related enzyme [Hyphomicrobiaceae bacterium]
MSVKDKPITALDLPPAETLAPDMQALFDKCTEKLGFIPNVLQAYSFDQDKLKLFSSFYDNVMLAPSGLSKLEREMIAVAVSSENRCFYCLVAHGAAVRALSKDPSLGEVLAFNFRAGDFDERTRAMLEFAVKLTRTPADIVEADRAGLRQAGFSDRDIWDIAATAAFYNMSNRMAAAVDMQPNMDYHARSR